MRRVICDVFILVTTISPSMAAPADCPGLCLPTDQPPQGVAAAEWWLIYQEFIFVHCQRVATNDDNVIDSA